MKKYSKLTKLLFRVIPGLLKLYRWSMFVKQDLVWYAFELQNKWIRDIIEKVRLDLRVCLVRSGVADLD